MRTEGASVNFPKTCMTIFCIFYRGNFRLNSWLYTRIHMILSRGVTSPRSLAFSAVLFTQSDCYAISGFDNRLPPASWTSFSCIDFLRSSSSRKCASSSRKCASSSHKYASSSLFFLLISFSSP